METNKTDHISEEQINYDDILNVHMIYQKTGIASKKIKCGTTDKIKWALQQIRSHF